MTINVQFPTQNAQNGFLHWLVEFEKENRFKANGRILHLNHMHHAVDQTWFSVWRFTPGKHVADVFHAALAFGTLT
jgi:hypothetical protein